MSLDPLSLTLRRLTGECLREYIPALAQLRIDVFREFPYLYDGSLAHEQEYLKTYIDCEQAVLVVALDGDTVVGASTGIPMAFEGEVFKQPLQARGIDVNRVFYCAESVLRAPYRGLGLGWRFFDEREAHAREIGCFDTSCFCAVQRPVDHARRPADYRPLDSLWQKRGYHRRDDLVASLAWKDLDDTVATPKQMTFWLKSLRE